MRPFLTVLLTLLLTMACSCSSSNEKMPTETPQASSNEIQLSAARGRIHLPNPFPSDWPLTQAQAEFLILYKAETIARLSVDPQELLKVGFQSPKELVAFAWQLLETDLTPIERDMPYLRGAGFVRQKLFVLIALHGDEEDAARLLERLKGVVQKSYLEESVGEYLEHTMLAESMGLFLMRDHFMPQKDRARMQEIEDYLLSCTRYGTPTCWPREDDLGPDDEMRRYALMALAISCGERGQARIQEYAEMPGDFSRIIADVNFKLRDQVLSHGEEIPKTLSPVLPREK